MVHVPDEGEPTVPEHMYLLYAGQQSQALTFSSLLCCVRAAFSLRVPHSCCASFATCCCSSSNWSFRRSLRMIGVLRGHHTSSCSNLNG